MAIGQFPEGAYRLETDDWISRGSGRVSNYLNPAVELLVDRTLPLKAYNRFFGSFARPGRILAGVDLIMAIKGHAADELGYNKPVLTICNGTTKAATDSNGVVRAASMNPVGTIFQHMYDYMDDRLVDRVRPTIDRGQFMVVPYALDPYYGDQIWVGAATGGCGGTSAGGANLNACGDAYSADFRVSTNYLLSEGDFVCSDMNGHFIKWIPNTTTAASLAVSLNQRVGQVLYIESVPMRGLLQTVMLKAANGLKRMYSDYDQMQPYPVPYGKDARAFLQNDKSFWPTSYGEIDEYGWPSQLKDFMGIPGLTDGVRMVATSATEDKTDVAIDANAYHQIQLTNYPIQRSEAGAVNPDPLNPYPSRLVVDWDSADNLTYTTTLKEQIDYTVNRHTGHVTILANSGAACTAIDNYRFTYVYLKDQKFGVPTNVDWQGSVGLAYICTNFNKS